MKEGVEKAQENKVKENDKTQLFVNGVEECVVEYMAKSIQNIFYYCSPLRFPLCFALNSEISCPFATIKECRRREQSL